MRRLRGWRAGAAAAAMAAACLGIGVPAQAQAPLPRWGAIAASQQWFGYAFDQPTREAAEQAARAQCRRTAGREADCTVRTAFNRQCGALAFGNYGEWGVANAPTREQAAQDAARQCNAHLPTEPCKVAVQVCSAAP
ncbi:DUF4189 domain-containing protein [Xenophilus sp. Marseille-Q4582]|uniref:DUF4189 domain-containing protein n=1 Tax=Xenophilus sp. Marseille-Q4582 TaxID=2866600 RepID=UPI001CE45C11|nr:DUF4189 domain-containing protein [Xenophilus sp. Marseille-Q4582]